MSPHIQLPPNGPRVPGSPITVHKAASRSIIKKEVCSWVPGPWRVLLLPHATPAPGLHCPRRPKCGISEGSVTDSCTFKAGRCLGNHIVQDCKLKAQGRIQPLLMGPDGCRELTLSSSSCPPFLIMSPWKQPCQVCEGTGVHCP